MKKNGSFQRWLACMLILVFAFTGIAASRTSYVYDDAVDLMTGGQYAEAAAMFDSISSYEDSSKQSIYCRALLLTEEGNFEEAVKAFTMLGDYKDCVYLKSYYTARQLELAAETDPKLYRDAADLFSSISLFRDSSDRAAICREKLYSSAEKQLEQGLYSDAVEAFQALDDYRDAAERTDTAGMLHDLALTSGPVIIGLDLDKNPVLYYSGDSMYEADLEAGQCFGLTLFVSNKGDVSRSFVVKVDIDEQAWTFYRMSLETDGSTTFTINQQEHPDLFTAGAHPYTWYIDGVPVLTGSFTMKPDRSPDKLADEALLSRISVEHAIAQYDEVNDCLWDYDAPDSCAYLDELLDNCFFAPVIRISNPSNEKVSVTARAVFRGEPLLWPEAEIKSGDSQNFYLSSLKDAAAPGEYTVSYYINSCYLGDYTFTLKDVRPAVEGAPLSYAEFMKADPGTAVCIEACVQAHQAWQNGLISVYAQDQDGGYYIENMACTAADASRLIPGVKIRVNGLKIEQDGGIKIIGGQFSFVEGGDLYLAEPADVTVLLASELLRGYQNMRISLKNMILEPYDETGAAFVCRDPDGHPNDLVFRASNGGEILEFYVDASLCGEGSPVYRAAELLKPGQAVDLEGFLFWNQGAKPKITFISPV